MAEYARNREDFCCFKSISVGADLLDLGEVWQLLGEGGDNCGESDNGRADGEED